MAFHQLIPVFISSSLSVPPSTLCINHCVQVSSACLLSRATLHGLFPSLECPSCLCPSGKFFLPFKFSPCLSLRHHPPQEINCSFNYVL
jgi:hypothetical protein